jgi:glycosyltransferase involved in cell wall biosynthesis
VFPTYWPGEGYPGIILEAYGAGLPVITTRWMSIPEIADDTCGILIEPRSADALAEAMTRLTRDDARYRRLCEGARAKRDFFNADRWVDYFVQLCKELAGR